ncbi:MAG: ATP-binding protein [Caldilineaceae bacterium]|nr:ATP-binding protein [Caldilineaceae bacterium]
MKSSVANTKERKKFDAMRPAMSTGELELSLGYLQAELARIDAGIRWAVARWQQAGRDPNDAFRGLVVSDDEANQLAALPIGTGWGDLVADEATDRAANELLSQAARQSQRWLEMAAQQQVTVRLQHLARVFELSSFELDTLLLCIAPSLDLRYEQLFSYLQNDINRKRPTVNLALQLLGGAGLDRLRKLPHFAADAPLLRHHLLQYAPDPSNPNPPLLAQTLNVDRTVVNWLLGDYHPAAEFGLHVQLSTPTAGGEELLLSPDVQATVEQAGVLPHALVLFSGPDSVAQMLAAHVVAVQQGRPLLIGHIDHLLAHGMAADHALDMILRDALLNNAIAYLPGWDALLHDRETPSHLLAALMAHPDLALVASRAAWQPSGQDRPRVMLTVEFGLPDYAQRQLLWKHYLATHGVDASHLDPVAMAGQFSLTTGQIRDAVASARNQAIRRGSPVEQPDLFAGARLHSGARLGDMARKIIARYGWDDIILPGDQVEILRELVSTVRQRSRVLEEWGLGKKLASSGAVTVLFAGPPGTGKTMAAEVIAKDLGLDLYKIDLSNLVSKYIGETEKNLERIFTEAQSSNAILFFDEADAIFGKRSGVKDAHDRYANLEISYLLQRMETYDGVTILATNLRSNLDEAFLRRLQFAIDIPFPDEKHRLQIWETLFPTTVPRAGDVDLAELARRFRLAGGNIRNILVSASYLAAADSGTITMQHLLHGTRREFQKMGRLVMDT